MINLSISSRLTPNFRRLFALVDVIARGLSKSSKCSVPAVVVSENSQTFSLRRLNDLQEGICVIAITVFTKSCILDQFLRHVTTSKKLFIAAFCGDSYIYLSNSRGYLYNRVFMFRQFSWIRQNKIKQRKSSQRCVLIAKMRAVWIFFAKKDFEAWILPDEDRLTSCGISPHSLFGKARKSSNRWERRSQQFCDLRRGFAHASNSLVSWTFTSRRKTQSVSIRFGCAPLCFFSFDILGEDKSQKFISN